MHLRLMFGINGIQKELEWDKDLMDFPKLLSFNGKKWEWFMYDQRTKDLCELTFTEINTYNSNYYVTYIESLEDIIKNNSCECGAVYSYSFPWDHLRYCKKWKPW